jgi:hypothetical protein
MHVLICVPNKLLCDFIFGLKKLVIFFHFQLKKSARIK